MARASVRCRTCGYYVSWANGHWETSQALWLDSYGQTQCPGLVWDRPHDPGELAQATIFGGRR